MSDAGGMRANSPWLLKSNLRLAAVWVGFSFLKKYVCLQMSRPGYLLMQISPGQTERNTGCWSSPDSQWSLRLASNNLIALCTTEGYSNTKLNLQHGRCAALNLVPKNETEGLFTICVITWPTVAWHIGLLCSDVSGSSDLNWSWWTKCYHNWTMK